MRRGGLSASRFAANIGDGWLWPGVPLRERFALASRAGFVAVEAAFPYDHLAAAECRQLLESHRLKMVLINTPARLGRDHWHEPDYAGTASLAGREARFREDTLRALEYASEIGCGLVHVMAGAPGEGASLAQARETLLSNLRWAAGQAEPRGLALVVEAISPAILPRYFVGSVPFAAALLDELATPSVGLLLDFFQAQVTGGDLTRTLERNLPRVAHVQIAGVPDRHEPCFGEVSYDHLFGQLARLGYGGHIGCEYRPKGDTDEGLALWFRDDGAHQ